jgi:hypothetical protein
MKILVLELENLMDNEVFAAFSLRSLDVPLVVRRF